MVLGFVVMFGLFPVGNGGLRDWFVSFSCGEKEKDALRRPQNKNEKIKYRFVKPFSFVSFSAFAWCKGSVFLLISAKTVFVFRVFNRCFQCFQCSLRGFRGSNAAFADFEAVVDVFFLVVQHGGEACGVPDCGVEGWEMGVSVVGFEELGDVKGVAVRQDLLIECGSADAVEGFAV